MINANINSPVKFWKSGGYGFDTAGLKFLFDPARMLNMQSGLDLGSNLVTNGDFHDFTMENDGNTKGHWIFDSYRDSLEGGDGIENDWSGNSNDLTPNNFETDFEGSLTGSNPAYENGNALEFDGVVQYLWILAASATDFNPGAGDFTIEAWIKTPSAFSADMIIMGKRDGALDDGYVVYIDSTGHPSFVITEPSGNQSVDASDAAALTVNTWYHIAVVFDRDGNGEIYVNGVSVHTANISAVADAINPAEDMTIGKRSFDNTLFFQGHIAEVRFSDKVRTYAEIQRSYGAGYGWTPDEAETDTLYLNSSFKAGIQQVSGADSFSQALTLENGELYRIEITAHTEVGGNNARLVFDYGSANMDTGNFDPGDTATKFVYYQRTNGTACGISLYGGNAAQMNFYDNIKVQKVQNILDADFSGSGVVKDYSPSGFNGQTANSLEDDQPVHPSGISFDGAADYITHGDVLDLSTRDALIAGWFRVPDGTPASPAVLLGKFEDGSNEFYFRLEANGSLTFAAQDNITVVINAATDDNELITADIWHHIAWVLDRDGNAYCYLDGVAKDVTTITMEENNINNTGEFRIGEYGTAFSLMDVGMIVYYIFDGADGAPAALPATYEALITSIYNWGLNNRFGYGTDK